MLFDDRKIFVVTQLDRHAAELFGDLALLLDVPLVAGDIEAPEDDRLFDVPFGHDGFRFLGADGGMSHGMQSRSGSGHKGCVQNIAAAVVRSKRGMAGHSEWLLEGRGVRRPVLAAAEAA